eukprot:jgi/Psemu1/9284/gm1.9284_g
MAEGTRPLADNLSENESVGDQDVTLSQRDSLGAPTLIWKRRTRTIKRDEISISTIAADDQSVVSDLSSCDSKESSVGNMTFLFDALTHQKIDLKKSMSRRTKRRVAEKKKSFPIAFNRIFLNVYNSMFDDQTLEATCVDDMDTAEVFSNPGEVVFLESRKTTDPILTERRRTAEEKSVSGRPDGSHSSSNHTMFVSYESDIPTLAPITVEIPHQVGFFDILNCDDFNANSTRKSGIYRVPLNDSTPITGPEYLACSSSERFLSTSLSVNESCSSILASDEETETPQETLNPADKTQGESTGPLPSTSIDIAMVEASLFDTPSFDTQIATESESRSIASQTNEGKALNHVERDSVDKSGLVILSKSSISPSIIQRSDVINAKLEAIEVDDTGNITNDDIIVDKIGEDGRRLQHSSRRDIYLSYTIETQRLKVHDETSQSSDTSNVSALTPKHNSILKSFSVPKWRRRLRLFSGSRDKKEETIFDMKLRSGVCDSPGATTASTIPFDESPFDDDGFFNRTAPYLIRPRTREHYRINTAAAFSPF